MRLNWGLPLWQVDFTPQPHPWPTRADAVVVGGGLAGLSAAVWLRTMQPRWEVVLLEADRLGAGASGRTGGIVLPETAAGDLPGLGDVLAGFVEIVGPLEIDCDLFLTGAYEIGRSGGLVDSPIVWTDAGTLRVVREIPGGTVDPGKLIRGLARAAESMGVALFEQVPVLEAELSASGARLHTARGQLEAARLVLATNAESLHLSGLTDAYRRTFTLAVATAPLAEDQVRAVGLGERKPFYTIDLPYLWGRMTTDNRLVVGSGLVDCPDDEALHALDLTRGEVAVRVEQLESRLHGLHPALEEVVVTHRWGGPMLFRASQVPVLSRHPACDAAVVLNGLGGHGVALAVYLGRWAAEILAGRRSPPAWGRIEAGD